MTAVHDHDRVPAVVVVAQARAAVASHLHTEGRSLRPVAATQHESDEALMHAYQRGDARAFERLFERYAPLLLRLGRRHLGSQDAARELTQQTFLRLHAARADFTPGQRLHPWLMTITMNLVRDQWRSRRRRPQAPLEHDVPARQTDAADSGMQSQALHRALGELPQAQREVVELHWFQERPFSEVASLLGTTEGAARVRAHRAYARLKQLLTGEQA